MAEERKLNDQELARRAKLEKYRELKVNPYGQRFETNFHASSILSLNKGLKPEEVAARPVFLAGRIVLLRKMGKASFFHFLDRTGKIQCYIREDEVGDKDYQIFKLADLGDICGVKGVVMKTKTGEITIRVKKYVHLSKALKPLPDKFHGLTDKEDRYRKRYIDTIVNEDAREVALTRPLIIKELRHWFDDHGYLEVETPILQPTLGGANARPFITHHNALDEDFYLRIATELELKRLIVGGMERVYEVGRIFRNEGIDLFHNPEFTTVEAYQAYGDLSDMRKLVEDLTRTLALKVRGTTKLHFNGADIDLGPTFKKVTMTDMIKEKTGVDLTKVQSTEEALRLAQEYGVPTEAHFRYGHVVNAFFDKFCEQDLIQPVFVFRHPLDVSPLAMKCEDDPRFTQRFELYIGGHEMANAFTELNDPDDQLSRFERQVEDKNKGDAEASEVDYDYINALEYGLAPTGGIGIGIDRLVMLLTSQDSIREVILFPTLRRKIDPKAEEAELGIEEETHPESCECEECKKESNVASAIDEHSQEECQECKASHQAEEPIERHYDEYEPEGCACEDYPEEEVSPQPTQEKKEEHSPENEEPEPEGCGCEDFEEEEKEHCPECEECGCEESKIPAWRVNTKDLMDKKIAFHSRLWVKKHSKKPRWIKY